MNDAWSAVTQSGTTYTHKDGYIHIQKADANYVQTIKLWSPMLSAPETDELDYPWKYAGYQLGESQRISLKSPNPWHEVERPVIGERLYVNGRDEWRISTAIVSVTGESDD